MEALIYVANGLNLLSYFVRDILRLRAFTITAGASFALYFATLPEPMMELVYWKVVIILVDGGQLLSRSFAAPL